MREEAASQSIQLCIVSKIMFKFSTSAGDSAHKVSGLLNCINPADKYCTVMEKLHSPKRSQIIVCQFLFNSWHKESNNGLRHCRSRQERSKEIVQYGIMKLRLHKFNCSSGMTVGMCSWQGGTRLTIKLVQLFMTLSPARQFNWVQMLKYKFVVAYLF